jgi:hypothetical protein
VKPNDFPHIPADLLTALEDKFPDSIPTSKSLTIEDFRRMQGNREVINFLRHQFEQQNKNILEDT